MLDNFTLNYSIGQKFCVTGTDEEIIEKFKKELKQFRENAPDDAYQISLHCMPVAYINSRESRFIPGKTSSSKE